MRTRDTVIKEIYVAFEKNREVWFLDSAYSRNDDILIGPRWEVEAILRKRHGFAVMPIDWELKQIPDVDTFKKWFGIF
jgi:hypothetical protein